MLDRDTKGHLALGLALVDCLTLAGMTLPQAQAFFLVAMDEGRSVSEYAERAGASNSNMTRRLLLTPGLGLVEFREPNVLESRWRIGSPAPCARPQRTRWGIGVYS